MKSDISMEILNLNHAEELFELTEANRQYLREWLPWLDITQKVSDTEKFIESTISGSPTYALLKDGEICGVAGFHEINKLHKTGAIGYWLAENYTGEGIVTTSVRNLLEVGFNEHNLNKIEIHCAEENLKSRAVPERLGFMYEATLRQCHSPARLAAE